MSDNDTQPATIERLGIAPMESFAMLACMELDVFTPLEKGSLSSTQIADALGLNEVKLRPLLHAMVMAGLMTFENGKFVNTPESQKFLVKGAQTYLGGRYEFYREFYTRADKTVESVRSGEPCGQVDYLSLNEDERDRLFRGLHSNTMAVGRTLVEMFDFSGYETIIDVGGGSGGVSIALAADVLNDHLPRPFDAAVMKDFVSVIPADTARQAIKVVGEVLKPGGTLYLHGYVTDDSRISPRESVLANTVYLNLYDGGIARTKQEHRDWLLAAGFTNIDRVTLPNGKSVIVAAKE